MKSVAAQSETKKVANSRPAKGAEPSGQAPKKPGVRKNTGKQSSAQVSFAPEERRRMIEVRAYFLAQERGFAPGNPEQDWLAAEAQIDALLIQSMAEPGARTKHS